MREVVARAPARIDFGGGWTDVPPYSAEQGGCVCNLAITRHATVWLRPAAGGVVVDAAGTLARGESAAVLAGEGDAALPCAALRRAGVGGVHLRLRNDFPRGAGLGGSSAAGVALQGAIAAWRGEQPAREVLAERSRAVEVEELRIAGGSQDHYAAALGGALALRFDDGVRAEHIPLASDLATALERRCIVAYTGESRISGETITAVMDAYRARERRVTAALARMRTLAEAMIDALARGSVDDLASLVAEHWEHQRALHPRISTPGIERVLDLAKRAGAQGGKALGASGGGSVLVIASEERAPAVRGAVALAAELLPFGIDPEGVHVTVDA